jgi:oligopeptide/dipeptide ABC transporter ATP-binding protein
MPPSSLLEVKNLSVHYETRDGDLHALRDVSLEIAPGETFGLAGESGSGKSTLGFAILRALADTAHVTGGVILFEGRDLLGMSRSELRRIRGRRIAMVYQDPRSALNPTMRIGAQIAEVLEIHERTPPGAAMRRAHELLELVQIPDAASVARRYPHQLSGGMQQRVVIAMALAAGPSLLVLDEPTTGLDVTTQARILELVADLKRRVGAAILYISHDLAVIAQVADRVGVLYAGELVEVAPVCELFARPAHPYTRGLLDALPQLDGTTGLTPIEGRIPRLTDVPQGCVFAPRCEFVEPACTAARPALEPVAAARHARCIRWQLVLAAPRRAGAPTIARDALASEAPILAFERVSKHFGGSSPLARRLGVVRPAVRAVDDVSFDVRKDEVFALVGESGCGKSTLGRLAVRLLRPTAGHVRFHAPKPTDAQIVFQHPDASLNPMKRVGGSLGRPLVLSGLRRAARRRRVGELLKAVRLDPGYARRRPRELSGGEKQRVAIARALAMAPRFVVLDEPVSSLDVSTQASIIRLLAELRRSLGASYLLISHDLALVRHVAARVAVMYLGRIVELGAVDDVFRPPWHPYTQALLSAVPRPDPVLRRPGIRLEGSVPSAESPPAGCRFHTRCPRKIGRVCEETEPPLLRAGSTHWIACHLPLADLANDDPPAPNSVSQR